MTTEEKTEDAWELESGLPNDVDAWMKNCRFGIKDEYAQAVVVSGEQGGTPGLMFIADLVDDKGELIGSQGWSVGSGWTAAPDGFSMNHPTRKNVVRSSRYGDLQLRARELGLDMNKFGKPTQAKSWDNLGFHWMLEEHATILGQPPKSGIMPSMALEGAGPTGAPPPPGGAPPSGLEATLVTLVQAASDAKAFQKEALKVQGVTADDELMSRVLDEGPEGFFAKNKA